jgi:hypothetical protein
MRGQRHEQLNAPKNRQGADFAHFPEWAAALLQDNPDGAKERLRAGGAEASRIAS